MAVSLSSRETESSSKRSTPYLEFRAAPIVAEVCPISTEPLQNCDRLFVHVQPWPLAVASRAATTPSTTATTTRATIATAAVTTTAPRLSQVSMQRLGRGH